MRAGLTSTPRNAAPFMVAARGWAPPMPPRPAVTTNRPATLPPKCRRAQDTDGFSRLHQQGFVVLEFTQRGHDLIEILPGAGGLAGAAIDHEAVGIFGDFRVQVVHEHAEGGFLNPPLARPCRATRRTHETRSSSDCGNGHETSSP